MAKDYYAVLGVAQNATGAQVRARFRELARSEHPDRYRGRDKVEAERRFQEITEAFNVLSDPERRRSLDASLTRPGPQAPVADAAKEAARVYLQRGIRAYRQGNLRAAAESFERATREDPRDARAWHHLARVLGGQSRWLDRARRAAGRAVELEPMNSDYLTLAAELAAEGGDLRQASRHYRAALDWGGSNAEIERALADVERRRKRGGGLFGRRG